MVKPKSAGSILNRLVETTGGGTLNLGCLLESDIDTIESSLRTKMEELISAGEIEQAEAVEDTINSLDHVPVCDENYMRDVLVGAGVKEELAGAIGGRRYKETYSGEKSRY